MQQLVDEVGPFLEEHAEAMRYKVFFVCGTGDPTEQPSEEPTREPTEEPTAQPTEQPTTLPTQEPSSFPAEEPTKFPSGTVKAVLLGISWELQTATLLVLR